jgi:plastocyanin
MNDFKKKVLIPLSVPIISVLVVAVLSIGFSRVFLGAHEAGGEEHNNLPVILATVFMILIMLLASLVAISKKMRSNSLLVGFGLICVFVSLMGGILYGSGELEEGGLLPGQVPPAEQVDTNALEVDALPTNSFQAKEFDTASGVIKVDYVGKGGGHDLTIKDSRFGWFKPKVNGEQTVTEYINLEPGTYYIFCSVPGHEQAGMFADLVVQ